MVSVQGLAKHYGPRVLFDRVSFHLNPGDKMGLVGANGAGKSTLMRILTGEEEASSGVFNLVKNTHIGFLKQDHFLADNLSIIDCVMMGRPDLFKALKNHDPDLPPDAYMLESKSASILEGLGIETLIQNQLLNTLSGGFKLRVLLAQVLASEPEILLLDEPTNHLDILTINWLESYLRGFRGGILLISHDRNFLDRVCNKILDIDYQTGVIYTGNYTAFEKQKELIAEQKLAEKSRVESEIAHKQAFVDKFRAKASKARQAQSRIKQIEKIDIPELIESSRRTPNLEFLQKRPSGKEVLKIEDLNKSFEKPVLKSIKAFIRRGEHVGIIGPNGVGKSTLLKILVGDLKQDSGKFTWGHETHIGYFAQDHDSDLKKSPVSAENWLWQYCSHESQGFVRSYLGRVLFSGDDAKKSLKSLSGGELARLDLARLMMAKSNVLVLDEPTNHLDIESIEALVKALQNYEGTLMFVSHDRWFLSKLATHIFEIKPDGYQDFSGTFEDYLAKNNQDYLDYKTHKKQKAPKNKKIKKIKTPNLKKELESLTQKISDLEEQKKLIDLKFCEAGFFDKTLISEQQALKSKQEQIDAQLLSLMTKWEDLELRQI